MSNHRTYLSVIAAAGGAIVIWRVVKARQQAEVRRRADEERERAISDAHISAAHLLDTAAEKIADELRTGVITVPQAIDKFINESLREVLSQTSPKLVANMFKGSDPHWVFIRRLCLSITRFTRQPYLPVRRVNYVDFHTGIMHAEMPSCPAGSKRFVVVSDTHMRHRDIDIPDGDVLIHCGDVMFMGGDPQPRDWSAWTANFDDFVSWLTEQQKHCPEVVFVAGNHDTYLEQIGAATVRGQLPPQIAYLCDSETCVAGGIRIYGSSFSYSASTVKTGNMAFQDGDPDAIRAVMDSIPAGIDVLLTHGPPQLPAAPFNFKAPPWNKSSCGDFGTYGCVELTETVQQRVRPRVHAFGHLHEAHGAHRIGETLYVSASSVSSFRVTVENAPIVFDVPVSA